MKLLAHILIFHRGGAIRPMTPDAHCAIKLKKIKDKYQYHLWLRKHVVVR